MLPFPQMARKQAFSLAEFVRKTMAEKGLTMRDVEERSGGEITNSYVAKIKGRTTQNLTLEKLCALARGLGVNAHELFAVATGTEEPRGFSHSRFWELFESYEQIERPTDRQLALWMLEGVKRSIDDLPKKKQEGKEPLRRSK